MKMNFSLNLVQTQKLVMTPELRQSIEILQYNSLELNEYIKEELLNNPILSKTENAEINVEINTVDKKENDIDWKSLANDFSRDNYKKTNYEVKEEISYDNFIASEETLLEHLLFQLQLTVLSKDDMKIAKYIIENIDSNGYLDLENEIIAKEFSIKEDKIENIINTIQTFEPLGICARSLEECLLIQANIKYEDDKIVKKIIKKIIKNHLEDLACNRISAIAKELNENIKVVQDACDKIKKFEPKPGRLFSSMKDVKYIVPDVIVKKVDGEYKIIVSESTAPRLYINKFYRSLLSAEINDDATKYIKEKLNSALKVIRSIEQRKNTVFKNFDFKRYCR